MKKLSRSLLWIILLLLAAVLMACGSFSSGTVAAPSETAQAPQETQPAGGAAQLASATPPAAESHTRGPGEFNLLAPNVGLEGLEQYHASLELSFNGVRDGAPYALQQTFEQSVDHSLDARALSQSTTAADGSLSAWTNWQFGALRYVQAGADQPCQVSMLEPSDNPLFDPSALLPALEGAEAAGEETVNDIPARVYTFDGLALNAGADSQATGKVWVAAEGGWVVKYELSLRSERLFGEGISGEQRWLYQVSKVGQADFGLPAACPQGAVDLPLPDGAQVGVSMPNFMRFTAGQSPAELASFYQEALTAGYWTAQSEPVESDNGTRLIYSRGVQDQEQVAFITIRSAPNGSEVTVYEILTDAVIGKQP